MVMSAMSRDRCPVCHETRHPLPDQRRPWSKAVPVRGAVTRGEPFGPKWRRRAGPNGQALPTTGHDHRTAAPAEVARARAVSRTTVSGLARSGELALLHTRGQVRSRPEAVDDFLAAAQAPRPRPTAPSPRRGRPPKEWAPPDAA